MSENITFSVLPPALDNFTKQVDFLEGTSEYFYKNNYNYIWAKPNHTVLALLLVAFGSLSKLKSLRLWSRAKSPKKVPQAHKWQSYVPGLDLLITNQRFKKEGCHLLDNMTAELGKTFVIDSFLGKMYVTADPDVVQKVLGSSDLGHMNKPKFYAYLFKAVGITGGIFTSRGRTWAHNRKLLNRSFTYKALQSYLGVMNKASKEMVIGAEEKLRFKSGDSFNWDKELGELLYLFTISVATSVIMGAEIASEEEISKFKENFLRGKETSTYRLFHPWLISDIIFRLHPDGNQYFEMVAEGKALTRKLIRTYKAEKEKLKAEGKLRQIGDHEIAQDVDVGLKQYRSLIEEMLQMGFSEDDIIEEVGTFLVGGHDTTVCTINSFMIMLALNPDAQSKCQEEIDLLFGSRAGTKEEELDFDLKMDDMGSLKYLERCLQETLRLLPPIPFFTRGIEKPLELDKDLELEAGSNLMINVWALHRDPEQFPNPLKFDPDRFLPENIKGRHKYAYIPFSANSRNCIAWKMAMIEIKAVMTWMLRNFTISTKVPLRFEDLKFNYEFTIKPVTHVNFVLKRRRF